jgi:hypothetical protein
LSVCRVGDSILSRPVGDGDALLLSNYEARNPHLLRAVCLRAAGGRAAAAAMPAAVRDGGTVRNYFASCAPGLEEVVARELLGADIMAARAVPGHAGVSFTGTLETGYRANLWLRVRPLASRFMRAA